MITVYCDVCNEVIMENVNTGDVIDKLGCVPDDYLHRNFDYVCDKCTDAFESVLIKQMLIKAVIEQRKDISKNEQAR